MTSRDARHAAVMDRIKKAAAAGRGVLLTNDETYLVRSHLEFLGEQRRDGVATLAARAEADRRVAGTMRAGAARLDRVATILPRGAGPVHEAERAAEAEPPSCNLCRLVLQGTRGLSKTELTRSEKDRRLAGALLHQHRVKQAAAWAAHQRDHHLQRAAELADLKLAADYRRTAAGLSRAIDWLKAWTA